MSQIGTFPFGQPVREVKQIDRSPKRIFVLGVYASAVHARWIGTDNKIKVKALAVASEPYIFWRGDGADEIIEGIKIPTALGKLLAADRQYNGPSGIALDDLILHPIGISRDDSWLCDLVPHSCVNTNQKNAIKRDYLTPEFKDLNLPVPSVPEEPRQLTDEVRRKAILDELIESRAEILILLGDKPIQWFMKYFDTRWKKLSDFVQNGLGYGKLHKAQLGGKEIMLLPLAHPRQIAKLGRSSPKWHEIHQAWIDQVARNVVKTRSITAASYQVAKLKNALKLRLKNAGIQSWN